MKKIEAIIRKTKFEDVKDALLEADIEWFSYYDVRGIGKARQGRIYRGVVYDTSSIERILVSIVVREKNVEKTVQAIIKAAHTGEIGQAGKRFCDLPATTTVCALTSSFWYTHSDRTPPPFFRSTTGTKSSGDGSTVEHTALPSLRMPTNAASGLSTTSIFPTRIPAAFPAEFPFGKCGTNTRQK